MTPAAGHSPRGRRGALRWAFLACWAASIVYLSLAGNVPAAEDILPVSRADLLGHVLLYGVLTALLAWAARWRPVGAAAAAFAFGAGLECLQALTGRSFDATDLLANAAGALLCMVAIRLVRASRPRG